MCGIAGIVATNGGRPSPEMGLEMARVLRHRGPDEQSQWVSPTGRCVLSHARLEVIDLSTGHQPMGSPDGALQVVFNGEIYNFRHLRRRLEAEGYAFRTQSDTEVLVHGYRAWGVALIDHLEGMFAFGIWDEALGRLTLARDRSGKKPLFFYRGDGMFAFASEMKALLSLPFVPADVDPDAIQLYLAYGYVPTPGTVYQAIDKLPPATFAELEEDGAFRQKRYWKLDFRPRPVETAQATSRVRSLLEAAVQRRLEADVPLGAFLSGGIDSTAVVGLMARAGAGPVRTFSIGFEDAPLYDETRYAQEVATRFGTQHTEFRVGAQSIDLIDDLVAAYDEPFGDSSAIPTYIVSGLAREHVTVALTGDGGDELFAGYARFRGAQLAEALPKWMVSVGETVGRRLPHHPDFRSPSRRFSRFFAAAAAVPEERTLRWIGYFGDELDGILAQAHLPLDRQSLLASFRDAFDGAGGPGSTSLSRALSLNFETYLPEDLLVKVDRCSMAHGLELRSPFLDTELMEYAAALPDRLKLRGGSFKWVLREAVRDLIPESVLKRGKMGFAIPLPEWLRGPWRPLLEERILSPDTRISEWVHPEPVRRMASEHLSGNADYGHQLWALLTLDAWLRIPFN